MGRKIKTEEKTENFNFTEEYIQKKLDGFFASSTQKYVMENLYVFGWESDKLIETRSGLIYEFEIKISKADFKNDFKNKEDKHKVLKSKQYANLFEEYFSVRSDKKPNYFYYAVPEGMITVDEVPEYAGLIYILSEDAKADMNGKYVFNRFYIVKNAPKLHSIKYTDEELKLGEKFYYNMLSWKNKYRDERKKQLLSEGQEQKMTYAELLDKYEKTKRENKAWKKIVDQNGETINTQQDTIYDDNKIIRAYRDKIKEYEKDFNPFDFEYKIINKED